MGSEDLAEYAVVSSRLLLYLVEPVRVVRLCLRVGFSRLMRRLVVSGFFILVVSGFIIKKTLENSRNVNAECVVVVGWAI